MNYGYIRVSTDKQDLNNQLQEIIGHCKSKGLKLNTDQIFQEVVSSRVNKQDRLALCALMETLKKNDTLIVSELSRLGRNTIEVLQTVQSILHSNIELRLLKENLIINGSDSITAKLILPILSAINELERDRISQRTKQALATKRKMGVTLGRPKGSFSGSKLDVHIDTIKEMLEKKVSVQSLARIIGTSRQNLHKYINVRKLKPVK
jgi:DNA invertase Pin-like site-specific DNA recombinase